MLSPPPTPTLSHTLLLSGCVHLQVSKQDANGHTALHIAALLNHHHLIGPLLAARVDTGLKDNSGRTAHQLAMDKGSDDVLRQLDALKL